MISDTLHDAIAEIDRYLADPAFAGAYADPALRAHILRVRGEMDALRAELGTPPAGPSVCPECRGAAAYESIGGRSASRVRVRVL